MSQEKGGRLNLLSTVHRPTTFHYVDVAPGLWPWSQERRARTRFPIALPIQYFCRRLNKPTAGRGRSVNVSSSGLLFTAEHTFVPGERLELQLEWPAPGGNLHLFVVGRIVRVEGYEVGLRIVHHKFKIIH